MGPAGALGRIFHWTGVVMASLCALLALEFLVEGWAFQLSRGLLITALALTFGARAVRFALARE